MTHLWTGGGGGPPDGYAELILCRDIYHCPPSQLAEEDMRQALMMLELHWADRRVKRMREIADYEAMLGRK